MTTTPNPTETTPAPAAPERIALEFADATGRVWPLRRVTVADLDALKAAGLDLEDCDRDMDRLAAAVASPRRLAALLWWFVGEAVTAAGVAPETFHAALDGEALSRAVVALRDAVIDFQPYPAAVKAEWIARLNARGAGAPTAPAAAPAPAAGDSVPQQQLDAIRRMNANTAAVPAVAAAVAG